MTQIASERVNVINDLKKQSVESKSIPPLSRIDKPNNSSAQALSRLRYRATDIH